MDKLKEYQLGVTIGAGLLAAIVIFFVINGMVDQARTDLKPITQETISGIRESAAAAPKQADVERRQKEKDAMYAQVAQLRALLGSEPGQRDYAMQRWLPSRGGSGTIEGDTFTASLSSYVDDLQRHYQTFAVAVTGSGRDTVDNADIFRRGFQSSEIGQEALQKRYWLLAEVVNTLSQAIDDTRKHYQSPEYKAAFKRVLAGANPPGAKALGTGAPPGTNAVPAPDAVAEAMYTAFYEGATALPVAYIRNIDWMVPGDMPLVDVSQAYNLIPVRIEMVASIHLWPILSALLANPPAPQETLNPTDAVQKRPGVMLSRIGWDVKLDRLQLENQFNFTFDPFRAKWIEATGFRPEVDGDNPPPPRIDSNFDKTAEGRNIRIFNQYFQFLAEHSMGPGVYRITLSAVAVDFDASRLPELAPAEPAVPVDPNAAAAAPTG